MTKGDKYLKIVEWSDEDGCFLGSCPELFYGGCHGSDPKSVFAELCEII
jgi:predicted RNase H-like HicB family nuclease